MSAFMCTDHHIAVLAEYAVKFCHWRPSVMAPGETRSNAELLGSRLWRENYLSLEARYGDGCADMIDSSTYRHSRSALLEATRLPAIQILKGAQCYQYQACEHDGWEASEAREITDAIIEHAIHALPGYDEAKWGMPDPARQAPEPANLYHAKIQALKFPGGDVSLEGFSNAPLEEARKNTTIAFEHDDYLRVVSTSAESAKRFFGRDDEPVDLGPAPENGRWKPGARVWGFRPHAECVEPECLECAIPQSDRT